MPVVVKGAGTTPPPVVVPGPPADLLQLPVLTLTTPDEQVVPLSDITLGWCVEEIQGLGSVPRTVTTAPRSRGGVRMRNQRLEARTLILTVLLHGRTPAEFAQRWLHLEGLLCDTDVDRLAQLTITRPGQPSRTIDVYYVSGFDGEPGYGIVDDVLVLTLGCPDGLFRSAEPIKFAWAPEEPVDFFTDYPAVSGASVGGSQDITNPGQVDAWGAWTIRGPASGLTAAITTAGVTRQFTFTPVGGPLGDGQVATITSDPRAVIGPAGQNWTQAINWSTGRLWPIPRGESRISMAATGGVAGKTRVAFEFYPRWRAA
ncbi:hypothetical protein [Micromonospora chalcea]|uniref:hypothetical protein n=1 Tax=Micromonospora chalcea TaxID=1874 RepID=UPI0037AE89A9